MLDENTVFPLQGNYIRYCAQADQIQIALPGRRFHPRRFCKQGLDQLQSHPDPG